MATKKKDPEIPPGCTGFWKDGKLAHDTETCPVHDASVVVKKGEKKDD